MAQIIGAREGAGDAMRNMGGSMFARDNTTPKGEIKNYQLILQRLQGRLNDQDAAVVKSDFDAQVKAKADMSDQAKVELIQGLLVQHNVPEIKEEVKEAA